MFSMRWTLVATLLILNVSWISCTGCNNGDYTPDPYDCNGFRQCQFGRWVQRNCAPELHFNRLVSACDFPWNANCELLDSTTTSTTSNPEDPTQSPTTSTAIPTTNTAPPTSTSPSTGSPPTHTPTNPTATPPFTTTTTISPPITITGPPTAPTTTTTSPPVTITGPPTTSTTTTTVPTITTSTTSSTTPIVPTFPTPPPALGCTANDGPYVQHLPHPNCAMFYKCVHGIPHEMLCPSAQHWAITLDRCDAPSEANCVDGAAREQLDARPPNYW